MRDYTDLPARVREALSEVAARTDCLAQRFGDGEGNLWTVERDEDEGVTDALTASIVQWSGLPPDVALVQADHGPKAVADVLVEREKQRAKWGDGHDDGHEEGELSTAAAWLASKAGTQEDPPEWAYVLDARHDRRGKLVIAAALLLAEIERLDRAAVTEAPHA